MHFLVLGVQQVEADVAFRPQTRDQWDHMLRSEIRSLKLEWGQVNFEHILSLIPKIPDADACKKLFCAERVIPYQLSKYSNSPGKKGLRIRWDEAFSTSEVRGAEGGAVLGAGLLSFGDRFHKAVSADGCQMK